MPNTDSNLYQRGNVWWLNAYVNGARIRRSLGTKDKDAARAAREVVLRELRTQHANVRFGFLPASPEEIRKHLQRAREAALRRDRERGRASDFSPDDLAVLIERAGGRCEVSGVPFSLRRQPGMFRRPLAPTIDRLDCAIGYTRSNCRIVCLAMNIAMNQWGDGLFRWLAAGYLARVHPNTVPHERFTPTDIAA